MSALLASVLVASFLGSLHCAGMCGGLSAFYASAAPPREVGRAHAAYHGARLLSYAALGAGAGVLGVGIDRAGAEIGLTHAAAAVAGLLVVGWGVHHFLPSPATSGRREVLPNVVRKAGVQMFRRFQTARSTVRATALGVCTALMPCGWLYAFVVLAAGTSSPASGALLMATFLAGTVPALLFLGGMARRLARRLGSKAPMLTAASIVVAGLVTVFSRAALPFPVASGDALGVLTGGQAPCHAR